MHLFTKYPLSISSHIEAEIKWPPYRRRFIFLIDFVEWKFLNFHWNLTVICSQLSNWWYSNIGLDNGLMSGRTSHHLNQWLHSLQMHVCVIGPHWINSSPPGQMAAISQTIFWDAFSPMKRFVFQFEFHWSLFLGVQLIIGQDWFSLWLGTEQATNHYLNQRWPSSLTHICGTSGRWVNTCHEYGLQYTHFVAITL